MLEQVSLHQARFHVPGALPDARGVLLGKLGVIVLPAFDRLVSFLGLLSDEQSLEDMLPATRIVEVVTELRSREFAILLPIASSQAMDRAASLGRLLGGLAYTGTTKHFVKYRDQASPLGYDVDQLTDDPGDLLLYGDAGVQACARRRDVPLRDLVLQLSLRRQPRVAPAPPDADHLWLLAPRGLGPSLIGYLWRSGVPSGAALVERGQAARSFGEEARCWLLRVARLPQRMVRLFGALPGVDLLAPVADNVAVEIGYRHPLRLEACASLLENDRFHAFLGRRDRVEVLVGPPTLVPGERLVASGFSVDDARPRQGRAAEAPALDRVALRLVTSSLPPRRLAGAWIDWAAAARLRDLVFLLPPTVLASYRVAALDEGLLLVGSHGLGGVPLGELLEEATPGVLLPAGLDLLPRLAPPLLVEHLGATGGRLVVFRRHAPPLAVTDDQLVPLTRHLMGRLEVPLAAPSDRLSPPAPETASELANQPLGPLPLWGFKRGRAPVEEDE